MPGLKGAPLTPADLLNMRQTLVTALASGNQSIETPTLGRVEFRGVQEIRDALGWIDSEIARTAGVGSTFVAQSNRGTDTGGCCS